MKPKVSQVVLGNNYTPFSFDPYYGCGYGCRYCFARDYRELRTVSCDIHSHLKSFNTVIKENLHELQDFCTNAKNNVNIEALAFNERIPLQIGVNSDPFPEREISENHTKNVIEILSKYDYPIIICTKNLTAISENINFYKDKNILVKYSLTTTDDNIKSKLEPYAPKYYDMQKCIEKIANSGIRLSIRNRPALPHLALTEIDLQNLVNIGICGFEIGFMRIKNTLNEKCRNFINQISNIVNDDLMAYFNGNRNKKTKYNNQISLEYSVFSDIIKMYKGILLKNNVKFWINERNYGTCGNGWEFLRDCKIDNYNGKYPQFEAEKFMKKRYEMVKNNI